MRGLLINDAVRAEIARIVAHAAANPVDPKEALLHASRDIDDFKQFMWQFTMDIPDGFRVTFNHEHQPSGLCRHISLSVDTPNALPHPEAIYMLCAEFGMGDLKAMQERRELSTVIRTWVESLGARKAVNIVQLITSPTVAV